jgi:hypothetical protein
MEPEEPKTEEPAETPNPIEEMELPRVEPAVLSNNPNPRRKKYLLLALVIILAGAAGAYFVLKTSPSKNSTPNTPAGARQTPRNADNSNVQGLQLDPNKNYGDKYAGGILPVGDNLYTTDAAKTGNIFACSGYASNLKSSSGGAGRRGPWFVGTTEYDLNKKLHVQGNVMWQAQFSNKVSGNTRTIITNDLPDHPTGVFPISAADPAYAYDRNPNSIKGQTFTYSLNASPAYGNPTCIGGQVGIMLTGVALFSGFDAGGRDAGAWEVQDSCDGHPEVTGTYHYHTLSSCIKDTGVKTVIGFALDGFPITGPKVGDKDFLTSSDLDECHGLTSQVVLDGKNVTTYHYVMTQDFPYSVSCYRGTAIQPPGQGQRGPGQP